MITILTFFNVLCIYTWILWNSSINNRLHLSGYFINYIFGLNSKIIQTIAVDICYITILVFNTIIQTVNQHCILFKFKRGIIHTIKNFISKKFAISGQISRIGFFILNNRIINCTQIVTYICILNILRCTWITVFKVSDFHICWSFGTNRCSFILSNFKRTCKLPNCYIFLTWSIIIRRLLFFLFRKSFRILNTTQFIIKTIISRIKNTFWDRNSNILPCLLDSSTDFFSRIFDNINNLFLVDSNGFNCITFRYCKLTLNILFHKSLCD